MSEAIQELNEIINRDYNKALRTRPNPEMDDENIILNLELCNEYYRYDEKWIPEEAPPIIQFVDSSTNEAIRACSRGNLSVVSGIKKSRKSMLVSLLVATVLKGSLVDNKFKPDPKDKGIIMYFDTEQATGDISKVNKRIVKKSEKPKQAADERLYHYELKGLSPYQMIHIIEGFMMDQEDEISLVVIDGIADINPNFNDIDESRATVNKIQELCKVFDCHIMNVIHTSKTTGFTMGHLGAFLDNKCESHFTLKKDGESSTVEAAATRGKSFDPFVIYYDESEGVPAVDHDARPSQKEAAQKRKVFLDLNHLEHYEIIKGAFNEGQEYQTNEVLFALKEALHEKGLSSGDNKCKEAKQYYIQKEWITTKGTPGSKNVRFIWNESNKKFIGVNYEPIKSRLKTDAG